MSKNISASLLFFRDLGEYSVICSVVKTEHFKALKDGHQYVLTARNADDSGAIDLMIHPESGIDKTLETIGHSIEGVLKAPIWRTS